LLLPVNVPPHVGARLREGATVSIDLTKPQQFALEKIQEKHQVGEWFDPLYLPHIIRRPEYVCRLLEQKGQLEMRYVEGRFTPQFRLKPPRYSSEQEVTP
jgi:hypothetical protein